MLWVISSGLEDGLFWCPSVWFDRKVDWRAQELKHNLGQMFFLACLRSEPFWPLVRSATGMCCPRDCKLSGEKARSQGAAGVGREGISRERKRRVLELEFKAEFNQSLKNPWKKWMQILGLYFFFFFYFLDSLLQISVTRKTQKTWVKSTEKNHNAGC